MHVGSFLCMNTLACELCVLFVYPYSSLWNSFWCYGLTIIKNQRRQALKFCIRVSYMGCVYM